MTGPFIPRDILQVRTNNLEMMRRFGTPIIVKHMYNDRDVRDGIAEPSQNFSSVYGQTRHDDPLSYGVGFVSVEKSTTEWMGPNGDLVIDMDTSPGSGYVPAPKYRGYGPGFLTYAIMPDVTEDVFKLNEVGALIRLQSAQVQMGWYPEVNDNDLIITVELDDLGNVIDSFERYLSKMTNPISMRGQDRRGRRESTEDFGNRYVVGQQFEMTLIPVKDPLYLVEIDR